MRSQSYSGEPSIQISRKTSIELDNVEEAERLRIEARKKLDERIKQEEIMREQDIKRQEEVKKEVQALRIKKNTTPD